MKILLTGYTSIIGNALAEHLSKEHDVVLISRQSGYDLTDKDKFDEVLQLSLECDHVINLAYIGIIQTELLYSIHTLWTEHNNTGKIINVGTLGTNVPYQLLMKVNTEIVMIANKLALEKMHNELSLANPFGIQPQSILIRFAAYGDKKTQIPNLRIDQLITVFQFILDADFYISTMDFRETWT